MEFRPCIDIHNGKVKQIIGGSLRDQGDQAAENFVSSQDAPFFARLYKKYGLTNGHIILLNPPSSDYYEETKRQAKAALAAWPGGLQVGGGIRPENAAEFLAAGASHVIVTSYVFRDGQIAWDNLDKLVSETDPEKLVLDLSCRKRNGRYYIVTDRWQKFTGTEVTPETLAELSGYCDEFLIHAADVEGKTNGIERDLIPVLATAQEKINAEIPYSRQTLSVAKSFPENSAGTHPAAGEKPLPRTREFFPITYAGGIRDFDDLDYIREAGKNHIHATIGSALDLFGGSMKFEDVIRFMAASER